ncbi:MAG: 4Fe-4S binding protein [Desulfobacteraceae bacterium]|nr:4Fe-4S binding protein [Desulfobacteraceae bacterium]
MGFIKENEKHIFETEASWSDASEHLLCLDTGDWRTERPVVDQDRCNGCGFCVLYCPPQCMLADGEYFKADLAYCKGCGVCVKECPKQAIKMIPEGEFADDSAIG